MDWVVPRIWEGGDVWILGGGPSIMRQFNIPNEVTEKVLHKQLTPEAYSPYMEAIHKKHVIGINVAFLIGTWIDLVFFGDNGFFVNHKDALYKFPGLKVSCTENIRLYPWIKFLARDKSTPNGITTNPRTISWNKNSGSSSISIAVNAGAKRIFLLGFDMKLNETNNQHWLYRNNLI
jgi:hypothetical protein